jgi:hypothetical protein
MLNIDEIPDWIKCLEPEDLGFIHKFVLSSGSLKDMAKEYSISYPTIRLRLDKLIEKINNSDSKDKDAFVEYVKSLAIDGKFDLETAKNIIKNYKKEPKK